MLIDTYGRPVTNLRISLTPRCNLRCIYCHAEGENSPRHELPTDQLVEILRVARRFDIRKVKFTGGEPLLRPDVCDVIAAVPEGLESSMTTNGILIADLAADLKAAGLSRVNISLDSLDRERYQMITGSDRLDEVLAGVEASLDAGLTPVKLNMVLLQGINEDEVDQFLEYIRKKKGLMLQLIELMEFNDCSLHGDIGRIEESLVQRADQVITRRMHHRKKYCMDGAEVEVVRPLHNTEFCAFCNRLRVTSDGKLKPCLLRSDNLVDIMDKSGAELEALFAEAVRKRVPYFR